jgi:hypothetical protein
MKSICTQCAHAYKLYVCASVHACMYMMGMSCPYAYERGYACACSYTLAHTYTYTETRIDTYNDIYKNAHARVQELKKMPNAEVFFDRKEWFHESAVSQHRSGVPPHFFFGPLEIIRSGGIDMMIGGPRCDLHPLGSSNCCTT